MKISDQKIERSKIDDTIEMMHVPGGMIIFRRDFFNTATFVPIHDPENYGWWFQQWFPIRDER